MLGAPQAPPQHHCQAPLLTPEPLYVQIPSRRFFHFCFCLFCFFFAFFCFKGAGSSLPGDWQAGRQAAGICCNSIVVSRDWPLAGPRSASSRVSPHRHIGTGDTSLHFFLFLFLKMISTVGFRSHLWQPRRHITERFNARAKACATCDIMVDMNNVKNNGHEGFFLIAAANKKVLSSPHREREKKKRAPCLRSSGHCRVPPETHRVAVKVV